MSVFQYFNMVKPEFIFHKKHGLELEVLDQMSCVVQCVEGHVGHHISKREVFFHFISRRREEGEE